MVSHSGDRGGAERSLIEIAEALKNHQVTCFVLLPWKGPLENELDRIGIDYAIIPYRWWVDSRRWWRRIPKYIKTVYSLPCILWKLKSWKIDVVMTNTLTIPAGAVAAFLCRKPHVWHIHEFGKNDHGLSYDLSISTAAKIIGYLSDVIIVNSNAVRDFYARYICGEKLRTVYPGPHPRERKTCRYEAFHGDEPRLAILGAINEGKGQMDAVRALSLLAVTGMCAQLAVIGDGDASYVARLKRAAIGPPLSGKIHFLGWLDDPTEVLREAEIVLMCSRFEAFGAVTVEAMAAGKPVIGADSGGTPELIQDGFNGLLYKSGDVADLASKIKFLIDNPEKAREMGENGRKLAAERFTVEKYTTGVLQVFGEVLARKSTS